MVPLIISYSNKAAEGDDELREFCLQTLESFVHHSPHDARSSVNQIFQTSIRYLNYDPNYADDMEEDNDAEDEDMDEDDECV